MRKLSACITTWGESRILSFDAKLELIILKQSTEKRIRIILKFIISYSLKVYKSVYHILKINRFYKIAIQSMVLTIKKVR